MIYPARIRNSRALTVIERTLVAMTVAIAVATIMLAVAHSARATQLGTLPSDGPGIYEPASAISHIEFLPPED